MNAKETQYMKEEEEERGVKEITPAWARHIQCNKTICSQIP